MRLQGKPRSIGLLDDLIEFGSDGHAWMTVRITRIPGEKRSLELWRNAIRGQSNTGLAEQRRLCVVAGLSRSASAVALAGGNFGHNDQ
jgi:hypothetical protein